MLYLLLFALLAVPQLSQAASCAVLPGSIPAGSVPLSKLLAHAEKEVAKPEDLEVAVFGLG